MQERRHQVAPILSIPQSVQKYESRRSSVRITPILSASVLGELGLSRSEFIGRELPAKQTIAELPAFLYTIIW
jgi:hypothetical protein